MMLLYSLLLLIQGGDDFGRSSSLSLHVTSLESWTIEKANLADMVSDEKNGISLINFSKRNQSLRLELREGDNQGFGSPILITHSQNLLMNSIDTPEYVLGNDGSALVMWPERNSHGCGIKFLFRREAGAAFTEPRWIRESTEDMQHSFLSGVALNEGGFFITWIQSNKVLIPGGEASEASLVGILLDSEGQLQKQFVLDPLVCDCCSIDSAIFDSGNVVVCYRNRDENEVRDTFYVRGNPLTPESFGEPQSIRVEQWKTDFCPMNGPAIGSLGRFTTFAFFTNKPWETERLQVSLSVGGGKKFMLAKIISAIGTLGRPVVAYLNKDISVVSWLQSIEDECWWVARAVPHKGQPGPRVRIAKVHSNINANKLNLVKSESGVIASYQAGEDINFSLIELKQGGVDAAER